MIDKPPAWLDKLGKEYWKKLAPKVESGGANYDALAILCSSLSIYRRAEEDIQKTGLKNEFTGRKNGAFEIMRQAATQAKDYIKLLGLNVESVEEDQGDDPLIDLVRGSDGQI